MIWLFLSCQHHCWTWDLRWMKFAARTLRGNDYRLGTRQSQLPFVNWDSASSMPASLLDFSWKVAKSLVKTNPKRFETNSCRMNENDLSDTNSDDRYLLYNGTTSIDSATLIHDNGFQSTWWTWIERFCCNRLTMIPRWIPLDKLPIVVATPLGTKVAFGYGYNPKLSPNREDIFLNRECYFLCSSKSERLEWNGIAARTLQGSCYSITIMPSIVPSRIPRLGTGRTVW